ncbi:SNF2 family N-terminal domain-containing protein, partial [Cladorrhinum sp. PSN259]
MERNTSRKRRFHDSSVADDADHSRPTDRGTKRFISSPLQVPPSNVIDLTLDTSPTMTIQASAQLIEPTTGQEKKIDISLEQIPAPVPDAIVCFGMIIGIHGSGALPPGTVNHSVRLESSQRFVSSKDPNINGKLDLDFTQLLGDLLEEQGLDLESYASSIDDQPNTRARTIRFHGSSRFCRLDIILYGPLDLFDDLGTYLQERNIFLQDPVGCERNVRYCNPHRLPSADPSVHVLTSSLTKCAGYVSEMEFIAARPELLDILNSQEDLPEAAQPPSIKTKLARHQKQALTFMLERENGWAWDGSRPDIWKVEDWDSGRDPSFHNRISGRVQAEPPPQFYGGIIADPMGLGKTLSMIALVASDIMTDNHPLDVAWSDQDMSSGRTLIIVPPPLLGTWEEQIVEHVYPNNIPWRLHHGKSKLSSRTEIKDAMVVLTTYDTASAERKNGNSLLYNTVWRRIILDEAHKISNIKSQRASAICELKSVARWVVTGTPIQNELGDLASLLKFLQVYPYSDRQIFNTDITDLWKCGRDEEAVKRLKRLAGCLLLRRQKDILDLPARHDLRWPIDLDPSERQLYDGVRIQALTKIEEALTQSSDGSHPHNFQNVLQKIEAMRMICNLGLHYHSRHTIEHSQKSTPESWKVVAQSMFNIRREMRRVECDTPTCGSTVDPTSYDLGDSKQQQLRPLFTKCWKFLCSLCAQKLGNKQLKCGCKTPCPVAPVSTDITSLDDVPMATPVPVGPLASCSSSKISMLLDDLQKQPQDLKCVVFSTWRMTLDLIEAGLKQRSAIRYLRFDGKVPHKERQGVIDQFRHDASVRVLLLTISCGAVGLTLTAASRAYLMEPHWNPTQEDQALARIHRMGQTREVTTVRFVVKNSFEERVIEIQDSKRDLASIVLNPQGEIGGHSRNQRLESLRALI